MASGVDAVIAALEMGLGEAERSEDVFWKVTGSNRWIDQLPGGFNEALAASQTDRGVFGRSDGTRGLHRPRPSDARLSRNEQGGDPFDAGMVMAGMLLVFGIPISDNLARQWSGSAACRPSAAVQAFGR